MLYLSLFLTFFKIGAFTFGGGYAMLPLIQQEALNHGWLTMEELVDFVAVSESTPGPLAVNLSTYVGAETGGFPGAVCATLGVVLPSYIIILLVAKFFTKFQENRLVKGAMSGLRPAVVGLIAAAVLTVGGSVFTPGAGTARILAAAAVLAAALFAHHKKVHPILIILCAAAVGIGLGFAGLLE